MSSRSPGWGRFAGILPLVLAACGGGGGGPGPSPTTLSFSGVDAGDGYISSSGLLNVAGGPGIAVGDTSLNDSVEGYFRFDHTPVLPGATIVSAVFQVYAATIVGTPFTDLSSAIFVDHMDLGAGLDLSDALDPGLSAAFGSFPSAPTGFWTLDVTAEVQADVDAARSTTDFRLRFSAGTDGNGDYDFVQFTDATDSMTIGFTPALVVTWR